MSRKYVDPNDLIEFKEVTLRITQKEFDEWSSNAKSKSKSLDKYIRDSVEGQVLRSQILEYLDKQASSKPWWDKRSYNL